MVYVLIICFMVGVAGGSLLHTYHEEVEDLGAFVIDTLMTYVVAPVARVWRRR